MEKLEIGRTGVRKRMRGSVCLAVFAPGLLFLMLIAGCVSSSQQATPTSTPTSTPAPFTVAPSTPPAVSACTTKECFISFANDCNDIDMTLTEPVGVLKYSASKDCVFTKTLVSLNANETKEMNSLLQGKSLTCRYEKGKFDQRWITSLIFGTEYCEGELRDILVELIAFA